MIRPELPTLSENAVLHNLDQARTDCYFAGDKSDKALWMAFAERLRIQWNCMLPTENNNENNLEQKPASDNDRA